MKVHNARWWQWKSVCRPKCQPSTAFCSACNTPCPRFIMSPRLYGKYGWVVVFTMHVLAILCVFENAQSITGRWLTVAWWNVYVFNCRVTIWRVINCPSDYMSVINCRVVKCRVIKCHQTHLSTCGLVLRYKGTLKVNMKKCSIDSSTLSSDTQDRSTRRTYFVPWMMKQSTSSSKTRESKLWNTK